MVLKWVMMRCGQHYQVALVALVARLAQVAQIVRSFELEAAGSEGGDLGAIPKSPLSQALTYLEQESRVTGDHSAGQSCGYRTFAEVAEDEELQATLEDDLQVAQASATQ